MGQNTSISGDQERLSRQTSRRPVGSAHTANPSPADNNQESTEPSTPLTQTSPSESSRTPSHMATFRRRISAQSTPVGRDSDGTDRAASMQDEVLYEQEERPLVNMEDLRMRDAPITHITAGPMPRPPSVISRLGSRLLPRYSIVGSATEAGDDGGRALRRRLSDTSPPPSAGSALGGARHRFSVLDSITGHSSIRSAPRRRLAPISRPIPLSETPLDSQFGMTDSSYRPPASNESSASPRQQPESNFVSPSSRISRLSRVRRSISGPIENLFGGGMSHAGRDRPAQNPPRRPSRAPVTDETDYLLPRRNVNDGSLGSEEPFHGVFGGNDHERLEDDFSLLPEPPERPSTWTQRWAERTPLASRRDRQRTPGLMRGRSSRLIRRDDETPLSRILQLAAAAIAAQLAGSTGALPNMEAIGDDQFDGSLNNFVQELNNATNATGSFEDEDGNPGTTAGVPLNFWRVFRFGGSNSEGNDEGSRSSQLSTSEQDGAENQRAGTVTLVVVGVRSVPSSSINRGNRENREDGGSSLDTLLSLPLMPSEISARNNTPGGPPRNSERRSRFPHRRRSSLGSAVTISSQYDAQHPQMSNGSNAVPSDSGIAIPTVVGTALSPESPPGPNPPPSTPSDPSHLSNSTSSSNSPRQRPLSASAVRHSHLGHRDSIDHNSPEIEIPATNSTGFTVGQGVRPRRRSDSETARHRDLGAGAARRNGVVEPDHAPGQGRSWLIYVVGTNLQSDHPAFTAPSLFTDNPTYDDMMLLSSLLGPVKPPVASQEDVTSSPGIYRIVLRNQGGNFVATSEDGLQNLEIPGTERCLVCLSEYELEEELRQLNKCSHTFHRECIETWLTTGRNSCPLCRGQGVDEKTATPSTAPGSSSEQDASTSGIGQAI